jgi:eukaryotic translation initiation factor 2C
MKKGRCSVEIIKELDKMVIDLLQAFARNCGNQLPNRIVFYRDGVDDGQFQKVLDNEVNKVKDACRGKYYLYEKINYAFLFLAVYGNKQLPRLTFIVVKKRHHSRFFAYDGRATNNIEAGTVIDQDITHPSQFDFYLCSQGSL